MFAVVLLALLISVPVRAELRDPNNSADYIILTNQEVLSNNAWIDSLLDYRAAQGRVSMAVTVEEIWAEFTPQGSETAIREFLHYAYDNWQAPHLKDVFIVGHVDVVPSHQMYSIADSATYLSDYYYSEAPDSLYYGPRFQVGRIPWSPSYVDPLGNFFDKIRVYENSLVGEWTNRCHLIADSMRLGGIPSENWTESISYRIPSTVIVERDYMGRAESDPWYGDREEILANIESGGLITCFSSSCNGYTFLNPSPIGAVDLASLDNLNALPILLGTTTFALGRDTSNQSPLCFGALNGDSGGVIAAFGFSGLSWYFGSETQSRRLITDLFDAGNQTIGDAWKNSCYYLVDSVMNHSGNTSNSETLFSTFLLGDPATIIPGRTTSADPIVSPVVPSTVEIVGNYPNPFNPSTTINFMLNRAGNARLTVYDITGRAVTTLAGQSFTAGSHSIVWNAAGLASGIYLVRLESAGQFDTHKITLLK